jgi:hypothetical protein
MSVDEHEKQGDNYFLGKCAMYSHLLNGHKVRLLYKHKQLDETISPDLERALDERSFQKVDFWDLLTTVAVGGSFDKAEVSQSKFLRFENDTIRIHAARAKSGPCTDGHSVQQGRQRHLWEEPNFLQRGQWGF